jgi:5-methylcytosine-specific restriction endonuclease McrA
MMVFKRKKIDPKLRRKVYKLYNGICYLCGKHVRYQDMHIDHIVPIAVGGPDNRSNYAPTHALCNQKKGKKL